MEALRLLVTGSEGFIGKNLCALIEAAKLGEVLRFDKDTNPALLDEYAGICDFVFHLAGINRPQDVSGFTENVSITERLIACLERHKRSVPILMSSSVQALLDNPYGKSKRSAEDAVFAYAKRVNTRVCVYRLPGVFGKWCAPNYNSVVATFCHHAARGLPLPINDPEAVIEIAYIDDVMAAFLTALQGREEKQGEYCVVPVTTHVTVGVLAQIIRTFGDRQGLMVPDMNDALTRKLYSTYLSYLPEEELALPLAMHQDVRGTFAECIKSASGGQFSVNTAEPGVTKGGHWHHTKTEQFIIVSGEGRIRLRKLGTHTVLEYPVTAAKLESVTIPPGYIHEVVNTGEHTLVMVIWCSEIFDPQSPDTYTARIDE